jgi:hypothetical protein
MSSVIEDGRSQKRGAFGLCHFFMRGWPCAATADRPSRCDGAHIEDKSARPACPQWLRGSSPPCPFGEQCFLPHALPRELCVRHFACRAVVQVRKSHSSRVAAYLRDSLGARLTSVVAARAHACAGKADVALLLLVDGAGDIDLRAFLAQLVDAPFLATALVRCYIVTHSEIGGSEAALAWLLKAAAELPERPARVRARLFCFPKSLEAELADMIEARRNDPEPPTVELSKGSPTHLLSAVFVDGCSYMSIERADDSPSALWGVPSERRGAPREGGAAVCRAEHKLREVAARTPVFSACLAMEGPHSAIDIGAAPGGWTKALLEMPCVAHVYSVDPGDLDEASLPSGRYTHMRMRDAEAVALLTDSGAKLSIFVCDANFPTTSVLQCLRSSLPLLRDGGAVVVTLKNFDGAPSTWKAHCDEAEREFRNLCRAGTVSRLHLFANGLFEVTLVGNFCSKSFSL